jgi:hypothetical protein
VALTIVADMWSDTSITVQVPSNGIAVGGPYEVVVTVGTYASNIGGTNPTFKITQTCTDPQNNCAWNTIN